MADQLQAHEVIVVDETPAEIQTHEATGGDEIPAKIQAHEAIGGDEIPSGSMPSVQATDGSQNNQRNKLMYETTVALLEMKGSRRQIFLFLVALLSINILLVCGSNTFAEPLAKLPLAGKHVENWIAFLLWISGIIVINYIIFVYLPRFDIHVLLRRKLLYYIHGLKTNVSACIYFFVALVAWFVHLRPQHKDGEALYPKYKDGEALGLYICAKYKDGEILCPKYKDGEAETAKIEYFVLHVIISLLVGSILWLIKSTLLLVLATSFCCNRFFDRAKESLAQEYVITALDSRSRKTSGAGSQAKAEIGKRACVWGIMRTIWEDVKGWLTCGILSMLRRRKKQEVKIDIREVMKVPADEFPLYTKQLLVEAISDSVNWIFQENDHRFIPSFYNKQNDGQAASRILAKVVARKKVADDRCNC